MSAPSRGTATLVAPAPPAAGGRTPRRRWPVVAAVLLLLVTTAWVVGFTSALSVRSVRVDGLHRLDRASVLRAAEVPARTPLVRVPRGTIAARLERLPDVLQADVRVAYPSTVVITVTERIAAGVLQTDASTWVTVDETGHSFATLSRRPRDLPLLVPAPAMADDPATLAAMAQVAVQVPAGVRARLATVTATSPTTVTLTLTGGRTILWGASERNADKARVLPALLRRPGQTFSVADPDLVWAR
ncbi:MAG: FtsQ-type POTRA domain-containing protein [bacterium]